MDNPVIADSIFRIANALERLVEIVDEQRERLELEDERRGEWKPSAQEYSGSDD